MIQWTSGVGQKKRLRLPVSLGIRLHPKTFESLRLRLRNPASSHQQRDNKTTSQNNMWSLRRFYAQQATCQITRTSGDNWKNETCPPSPPRAIIPGTHVTRLSWSFADRCRHRACLLMTQHLFSLVTWQNLHTIEAAWKKSDLLPVLLAQQLNTQARGWSDLLRNAVSQRQISE